MIDGVLGRGAAQLSVMIPTFNNGAYLEVALRSVCEQGVERAQIEVVDDCSTADDPQAVVEAVGGGRIAFHRQPRNRGLVGNFNTCIERASRPWIHILHGDDFVLPGCYEALAGLIKRRPSQVAYARCVLIDELGIHDGHTPVLGPGTDGELRYDPMRWRLNPIQFSGALFTKEAAEAVGGFDDRFTHAADWDFWWKLAKGFPTAFTNEAIGAYRRFHGNHTSSLVRGAGNVSDGLDVLEGIAAAEPTYGIELYEPLFGLSVAQARENAADLGSVLAHLEVLRRFPAGLPRVRKSGRIALSHLLARARSVAAAR